MSRCEFSELPADQCACAHCSPEVREKVQASRISVTFTARFNTPCDHCEGRIKVDEPMGFDDDGNRVCERCLP